MLARGNPEVTVTLPSETEICFTCIFPHKRQTLFEAWTRPEHIRNWYGCEDATVEECEVDLRVGGAWRIVVRMPDQSKHHFHGTYREVVEGERLVYSECYEAPQFGNPEWITTVTFDQREGGVLLTHTIRHRVRAIRDAHLQSGMEPGMIASFDRLDQEAKRMATRNRRVG